MATDRAENHYNIRWKEFLFFISLHTNGSKEAGGQKELSFKSLRLTVLINSGGSLGQPWTSSFFLPLVKSCRLMLHKNTVTWKSRVLTVEIMEISNFSKASTKTQVPWNMFWLLSNERWKRHFCEGSDHVLNCANILTTISDFGTKLGKRTMFRFVTRPYTIRINAQRFSNYGSQNMSKVYWI